MLIQLPDGTWINPAEVQSVITQLGDCFDPQVVVRYAGNVVTVRTDCLNSATTTRDQIAEAVNTACAWDKRGDRP